ncbi:MAG: DnaD domain protein [Acholeplasmatales bacterium]|jgi:replication initiation and membrane attachment protein|nr:DnaD domain protein [Acholeplasmataceae bacterium]MCK9289156.1 DnaD domain protein [Acholeplasmataceae bacterium]MCK9427080.1 DnaD domain protein [Acholeplasmataceae bacterium]MDY0115093.1 DnaD domain protein [Acholeplasmatales bacterium]HHT39566.1 hypothetical protein [Acholeplasmataceae bacterium]
MRNKSFWAITHGFISSEDTKVLTLLYQPLIGQEALGLYLMLINLVDRNKLQSELFSLAFLFDVLFLKADEFESQKERLEAVGLLTTLVKDEIFLFKLSMPLKARQFFNDGILGAYLKSEIGEKNFKLLLSYFAVKEISEKGYQNQTKTFDEVFKVKELLSFQADGFILSRKNSSGIFLKESFDFDKIYQQLPIRIKRKSIFTKRVISQIAAIMFVYNFSKKEIIAILSDSYDEENRSLFQERIVLNARIYYEKTYGEVEIAPKTKQSDEIDLTLLKPQDIINSINPKMTNKAFALNTIREFVSRNAVDIGLINAVIIAALKYHENLPSLQYLEKVLSNWLAQGIRTGHEAYQIIQKIDANKKTKRKQVKTSDEPAWLDEVLAELEREWNEGT